MIVDKSAPSPTDAEAPPLPLKDGPVYRAPPYPSPSASQAGSSYPAEQPPPYVGPSTPQTHPDAPPTQRQNSHLQSVAEQEVNHLVLASKQNAISGSYIINTELPQSQLLSTCRGHPLDRKNRKLFGKSKQAAPNAFVYTRHGSIQLNLATAGKAIGPSKAHVQASSRHGKIHVNIYSLQENKHICLEAATRHGNVVLFIPPNFSGALQLRTRRGNIVFLPEFERHARIVNASDKGALVLFGQGAQPTTMDMNDVHSDSCLLSTRHGKVIIGVSGSDRYDEVQGPGLLEKLGSVSMLVFGRDVTQRVKDVKQRFEEVSRRLQ